jgi:hypothetical protein
VLATSSFSLFIVFGMLLKAQLGFQHAQLRLVVSTIPSSRDNIESDSKGPLQESAALKVACKHYPF